MSKFQQYLEQLQEEGRKVITFNTRKKWITALEGHYPKYEIDDAIAPSDPNQNVAWKEIAYVKGKKVGEWNGFEGWIYSTNLKEEKDIPDAVCKKCGNVMFKNGNLVGAYDRKDFIRFEKTGKCPYCK